jgi:hypothetical protein
MTFFPKVSQVNRGYLCYSSHLNAPKRFFLSASAVTDVYQSLFGGREPLHKMASRATVTKLVTNLFR